MWTDGQTRVIKKIAHRPDDGGSKDLWNVGKLLPDYTALQPRRRPSYSPPWEPQILLRVIKPICVHYVHIGQRMHKNYGPIVLFFNRKTTNNFQKSTDNCHATSGDSDGTSLADNGQHSRRKLQVVLSPDAHVNTMKLATRPRSANLPSPS
jgi:hypothetical protein